MARAPEHHVYFAVFGFGDDISAVTQVMGVEPTKAWINGEPLANSRKGRHTHSRWVLQSALPLAEPIEAHVENLLLQLECRREAVAEVRRWFKAHLAIAAYWYEVNPGFQLSSDIIKRIAALGLDMDFDVYCLGGVVDAS